MITMLNEYEVKPVLVFDGMKLKAKDRTAQMRKKLKTDNLKKALELRDQGK
jgi:5'-3' exonuclease